MNGADIRIGNVSVITTNVLDQAAEDYVENMMQRVKKIADACGMEVPEGIRQALTESVLAIQLAERNRLREQMRQDF